MTTNATKAIREQECYRRARKAVWKACVDSEFFDHGGFDSGGILEVIEEALRAEFFQPPFPQKGISRDAVAVKDGQDD